jgi:hypothetical protein
MELLNPLGMPELLLMLPQLQLPEMHLLLALRCRCSDSSCQLLLLHGRKPSQAVQQQLLQRQLLQLLLLPLQLPLCCCCCSWLKSSGMSHL